MNIAIVLGRDEMAYFYHKNGTNYKLQIENLYFQNIAG